MCSLYSINNSSKFAGQSSFQVVLCARGTDSTSNNQHHSSGSAWSASCSHSKRKKMKGGITSVAGDNGPILVLSSSHDETQTSVFNPPSFQTHDNKSNSPPRSPPQHKSFPKSSPTQSFQQSQPRRRGHSSHGTTHWQQFHQHNQFQRPFDASFDNDLGTHKLDQSNSICRQKRASWSNESQNSTSYRDSGNRRSSQILNPTNTVQFHSKTFSTHSSSSTPIPSNHCNPSSLLPTQQQRSTLYAHVATHTTNIVSRPVDTTVTTFAAAVGSAASSPPMSSSSPRSSLSTIFRSKETCAAAESLSSPNDASAVNALPAKDSQPLRHSKNVIQYSSEISSNSSEVDDLSSPMGTSVDSNTNEVFDDDEMELQHSNDRGPLAMRGKPPVFPLARHTARQPDSDSDFKLERKSRRRRKIENLRARNAALKSIVTQLQSDLALEQKRRSDMDDIHLKIEKELRQKLEKEESEVLDLKEEKEKMAAELKKVKDQLATAKAGATVGGKSPTMGYKIGYDNRSFSLSSGLSNVGNLMFPHHTNTNLIDSQDDSEEFFNSFSYSPSAIRPSPNFSTNSSSSTFAGMSYSEDEDEEMEEDNQSDDEKDISFSQPLKPSTSSTSRKLSNASVSSLPTLMEEESEEEQDEDCDSEDEPDYAPCTFMEIFKRQQAGLPEDTIETPPADANETFESMAEKALFHAIRSKFTPGQAFLQLEELVLKYGARPDQTVGVIAKEALRWWEDERTATGGPASGGWSTKDIVVNKKTGVVCKPKIAAEKRIESFFRPLLLQFVSTPSSQKVFLEKLGEFASADARWLKNHNPILVTLCKFYIVGTKAVLEWWQTLDQPLSAFGHGGDNLRSLNSRFVSWLEDAEIDSDSDEEDEDDDDEEEEDSDDDSCSDSDDSDDDLENDDDDDIVMESFLDMAFPVTNGSTQITNMTAGSVNETSSRSSEDVEPKRRISFCTNNLYYSSDGLVTSKSNPSIEESGELENVTKKKYQQCPPFKGHDSVSDTNSELSVDDDEKEY